MPYLFRAGCSTQMHLSPVRPPILDVDVFTPSPNSARLKVLKIHLFQLRVGLIHHPVVVTEILEGRDHAKGSGMICGRSTMRDAETGTGKRHVAPIQLDKERRLQVWKIGLEEFNFRQVLPLVLPAPFACSGGLLWDPIVLSPVDATMSFGAEES